MAVANRNETRNDRRNEAAEIQVGMVIRDRLTGVKGVCIARTAWLEGPDRIVLQPQAIDGKYQEALSVSVTYCEVIEDDFNTNE